MSDRPTLLWVGQGPAPLNVRVAAGDRWQLTPYRADRALGPQLRRAGLAVISPDSVDSNPRRLGEMLNELAGTPAVAVFLLDDRARVGWQMLSGRRGQFTCVPASIPAEALAAQFSAAADLQGVIADLRSDIADLRKAGRGSAGPSETLDEEMRLAARLQRDFLPRRLPEVGPASFGVLYRPASFVSGDIYDIARLDETRVGLYIADAVGHGMPAALMTMFIKRALQTKRIVGNTYEILPPEVSLAQLNEDICSQELSSCQFCTAVYAVLDTAELSLAYARAGHPEPLLIRRDGGIELLGGDGCLLGVFEGQTFEPRRVQLEPGDRVLLYTDGAHDALRTEAKLPFAEILAPFLTLPREDLLIQLNTRIEAAEHRHQPADDITIIVLDVGR